MHHAIVSKGSTLLRSLIVCSLVGCGELVSLDTGDSGEGGEGGVDASTSTQANVPPGCCGCANHNVTTSGDATPSDTGYSIALATPTVNRFLPNGTPYPFRAANLNPNDIDFQDCDDNILLQFNLTEGGLGTTSSPDILEIWAGTTDCTQPSARTNGPGPSCWRVYPTQEPVQNSTINIYARSLTRYADVETSSVPNDGGPVTGPGLPESDCSDVSNDSACVVNVGIYFMVLANSGDAVVDAATSYSLGIWSKPTDGGTCSLPTSTPTSCD